MVYQIQKWIVKIGLVITLVVILSGCTTKSAPAKIEPPPPPRPGWVWIPGHWEGTGQDRNWIPGEWQPAPPVPPPPPKPK